MALYQKPDGNGGYTDDYIWGVGMNNARTADYGSVAGQNYVWGTAFYKLADEPSWYLY